jgi:hypothetical protein
MPPGAGKGNPASDISVQYRSIQAVEHLSYITFCSSVGDLDPDRRIRMFLGLPNLDPLEIRIRTRFQILPYSHKDVERTEIMLAK